MEFKRSLTLFDSVSLLFGTIIGSGVFFTSGFILSKIENPYIVLSLWLIGGLIAIAGALTYASPAVLFPEAGGDYIYLKEAYSPFVGFLSGWSSLSITFSATISALSLAFSKYLLYFFSKDLGAYKIFSFEILSIRFQLAPDQLIALLSIYTLSAVGYFGIKASIRMQNILSVVKFGGLLVFIFFGFLFGKKDFSSFVNATAKFDFSLIWGMLFGVVPVTFSYFGWNMVTYVAGEIGNPKKHIPLAIIISSILVISFYLIMNFLFLVSAPVSELKGAEGIGVIASKALFGDEVYLFLSLLFVWIILSSLSGIIIGGSRIYYAIAKDGLFFESLAKIHPKYHSPYIAILFQALYATFFVLVKDLESLVYFVTAGILLLSILTAITPFVFAKRKIVSLYKIPFYPFTPIFFIVTNLLILFAIIYEKPYEAIWGAFIFFLAVPVYGLFKLKKKSNLSV